MDQNLGVGGRLEDAAPIYQGAPQRPGVGQIAVVGHGQAAEGELGEQRLDVAKKRAAGSRIAHVADRGITFQPGHDLFRAEDVADQPERSVGVEVAAVVGDDAGRFLAPVLQGVQAQRCQGGRVRVAEDGEDAALVAHAVGVIPGCVGHGPYWLLLMSWSSCLRGDLLYPVSSPESRALSRTLGRKPLSSPAADEGDPAASGD